MALQRCLFSNPARFFLPLASSTSLGFSQCSCLWGSHLNRISDTIRAKPWISKFGEPTDKVLAKEKPDTPEHASSYPNSRLMSQCNLAGGGEESGEGQVALAFLLVNQQP